MNKGDRRFGKRDRENRVQGKGIGRLEIADRNKRKGKRE